MLDWKGAKAKQKLIQSVQQRFDLMKHQLDRYPANFELLCYMLQEIKLIREELIEQMELPYSRSWLTDIQQLQMEATQLEVELYGRLAEQCLSN